VNGRTYRLKLLTGLSAIGLALTMVGPSYAQSGPTLGTWLAGPDAVGSSSIIGRIEAPRPNARVNTGASLLVSGWALDVNSTSGSGVDGVEVWAGAKDKGGTRLASGSANLARADISDAFGTQALNTGFSVVVPAAMLQAQTANPLGLYVYLHTPSKGTWYKSAPVSLVAPVALAFPNDPIVFIAKPQDGLAITQLQPNSKITFVGIALDRNPVTDPNSQSPGAACNACSGAGGNIGTSARPVGIASVTAYIDAPPAKGDNTPYLFFGAPCTTSSCLLTQATVNNAGAFNRFPRPQASIISRQWGSNFDYSGWAFTINPTTLTPGWHTLFVTAVSSITGKSSTAQSTFQILDLTHRRVQP
jgi:hypothetical protein